MLAPGGDRAKLLKQVQDAGVYAVIAPNMGKQIVAFQAMFENAAATFPGVNREFGRGMSSNHVPEVAHCLGL
jgi:4-hydroxy-tetrahydrodipicolinate reductase